MNKKHILGLVLAVLMLINIFPTASATAEDISVSDEDLVLQNGVDEELITIEPEEDEIIFVEDAESLVREETAVFEQGYVRLPAGSFVFKSADGQDKLGFFAEEAVVYAVVSDRAENEADSWLEIRFDTDAAKEADEEYLVAYVQFGEVTVLDAAETEELIKELNEDLTTRSFEDHLLPLVEFVPGEEAAELLPVEEDDVVAASAVAITSQPKSAAVLDGTKVTFRVEAVGTGALSYAWQYKTPSGSWKSLGSTKQTVTITGTTARNGYQYRVVVTDEAGNTATSQPATLTVGPIVITSQPQSVGAFVGEYAAFSVEALGTGTLSYAWQYKTPTGSWKSLGSTKQTVKISVTEARNGYQYRVIVTDEAGNSITSNPATLNVVQLRITSAPQSVAVLVGQKATFSVEAVGVGTLSYTWQYKAPSGSWKSLSTTKQSITVTMTEARNGYQYRVIVTDEAGNTVTSDPAMLTIAPIGITSQPEDAAVLVGQRATFSVEAVGDGELSYAWQYKAPSSTTWKSLGSTKQSITITMTEARNGYQYRVVVTDEAGNTVTSDPATLTIAQIGITAQPMSVTLMVGEYATFRVVAKGVGTLTYAWEYKTPSSTTWKALSTTKSKLTVSATAARNGYQYRVTVTDEAGNSVTSEPAVLNVESMRITSQPQSVTLIANAYATFSVEVVGSGTLTYTWQYKTPTSDWKSLSSAKASLTVQAKPSRDGWQYRVVIKDQAGNEIISDPATLSVISNYEIDGVIYEPINATTCRVLSYSGSEASLVIPETVQGLTVVEIGEEAFMNNTTLVSIDLPDTITAIQARAFKGCTNLAHME